MHKLSPLRQLLPDADSSMTHLDDAGHSSWPDYALLCTMITTHKSPWVSCLVPTHLEPITEAHSCHTDPGGEGSPRSYETAIESRRSCVFPQKRYQKYLEMDIGNILYY